MFKYLLSLPLLVFSVSAIAERIVDVYGDGSSEYCYSEKSARNNAYTESRNKASEKCRDAGGRLGERMSNGSEDIKACSGFEKGNYKISVKGVEYSCILKN